MSSFFITGKLGSGKSLVAVGRMFEYLMRGCMVASNMDLKLDGYLLPQSKRTFIRIPDKPTVEDFDTLGFANTGYDEEKNGLLVLDELGSWFNSRSWQDKDRKLVLEWFLHLRKRGWDVFLLVQDISMVDVQLRNMLAEHLVTCRRLDRVPIPYLGKFFRMFGLSGNMPKVHRAKVFYGESVNDLHIDTWTYRGVAFYKAYDTKQIFSPSYPHGVHSVLSPWHVTGRYMKIPAPSPRNLFIALAVGLAVGFFSSSLLARRGLPELPVISATPSKIEFVPDVFVSGTFYDGYYTHALLTSGASVIITKTDHDGAVPQYQVGKLWYKAQP